MWLGTVRKFMSSRLESLGTVLERLVKLKRDATAIQESDAVSMTGLFEPPFMEAHTDFETFEQFLEASPWTVQAQEDFESIPDAELDEYVVETTDFDSWEAMLDAGSREMVENRFLAE